MAPFLWALSALVLVRLPTSAGLHLGRQPHRRTVSAARLPAASADDIGLNNSHDSENIIREEATRHSASDSDDAVLNLTDKVFVTSHHRIIQQRWANSSVAGASQQHLVNYSHGNQSVSASGSSCLPGSTIFDVGFYDGADSRDYMQAGYCVVGVEADPDLVASALTNFASEVSTGQLRLANVAISPTLNAEAYTFFYRSKCTREWNSFFMTTGCRSCAPPHRPSLEACEVVPVQALPCKALLDFFGMPIYMKLDIEGAETGCFEAMKVYKSIVPLSYYVSTEITEITYMEQLYNLGYQSYKLVRQDKWASSTGSTTGPWGDHAFDCRMGQKWRSYAEVYAEFTAILTKLTNDLNDPCPGGIVKIHILDESNISQAINPVWYDVHASLAPPPTR